MDNLDSDGDGLSDGDEVTFNRDEFVEGLKSGDCSRGIKMISDPLLEDGDKDGDMDPVDPHPIDYQLNDRFIYNTNLVYNLAVEYNKNNSLNSEKYNNKPVEALVFMFIRYFEVDVMGRHKYCIGQWSGVAGNLDQGFVDYVKQENIDLYNYFQNTDIIASEPNKYDIDLNHMAATISAIIYESDKVDGVKQGLMPEKHIDALAGWTGDMQSLINDSYFYAKENPKDTDDRYANSALVDYFTFNLGDNNSRCGQDDLNSDADAVNISHMILNDYYTVNRALIDYFNLDISKRFTLFVNTELDNSKSTIATYTGSKYFVVQWPILEDEVTISSVDSERLRDVFWNYLQGLINLEG